MTASRRGHRIFYGWYVLAASFVILFLSSGSRSAMGIMVKPMEADLDWTRGSISSVIFLNLAVYALAVTVTGRLYDRYGPKWIIAGSTLLFAAGHALIAMMGSLWEFYLYYGILNAAGLAGTTVALFGSVIGNWFERRRGLTVSLGFAGTCLGQFFLVPPFASMIAVSGWRVTNLWIAGLAVMVNLALAFVIIRGTPDQLGLQPYGRHQQPPVAGKTPPSEPASSLADLPRDLTLAEAMRSRSLWLFTVAMFACGSADFLVATHLVPMVTDFDLSDAVAASMLAWLGLLSLAGILIAGPLSDSIGNKFPIVITFALRIALFLLVMLAKGSVPFWVFSLGFGFTLLVTAPLTTTLVGALYGVKNIGLISGFVTTIHTVGGGVGVLLAGLIFDGTGSYDVALLVSAGLAFVAMACSLFIREKRHLPPGEVAAEAPGS